MHIQEGTNTTLTTCTKMTEEVRHGVNGNSSKGSSEDAPVHNSTLASTGGRLKFFKDGKFILELVRGCGREGERAGWVSVPRKTFWPPAAPPAASAAAVAPAAALSLSDDNSSVQSSPWQRDHCWKQAAPRRNLSKELALYYCRPATLPAAAISAAARAKRRRPHDTSLLDPPPNGLRKPLTNGVCDKRNGDADSPAEDAVDGAPSEPKPKTDDERWTDYDREKYYHMKLKKPYQYHKLRVYKKTKSPFRRKELNRVVDKLRERIASLPVPVNAKLANCRQEHMMVSPRKRILRELERVSLEDQGMKRRAKTVPALSTASYPPPPGPSHAKPPPDAARAHNGSAPAPAPAGPAPRRDQPVPKHVSSYSIHSLLSMPDESPRRSPDAKRPPSAHSYPASLKTDSPGSVRSPDLSPSPDGYRYRYSALALGSPGPGVARDSPTPPSELARYRYAGTPGPPPAPSSPYGRAHWPAAPAPAPSYRAGAAAMGARDEWRDAGYVYGYGFAPLLRPPPLWMHYAMAPAAPPGPWAPAPGPALPHPHPLLTDHIPKDEPTSDLPLNLSKH